MKKTKSNKNSEGNVPTTSEERAQILERAKEEVTLADLINVQLENGDWTIQEKLFCYIAKWLTRQRTNASNKDIGVYDVAINFSAILDDICTRQEIEDLFKELVNQAIHEDWEIIRDFR